METMRLEYFDFSASRGEECRLALHLAGVPFEDDRIEGPDWESRKAITPFGSVPVLHAEGRGTLTQTNAILVFIGRTHDLHPTDPWQAAKHEELLSAAEDLRGKVWAVLSEKEDRERVRQACADGLLQSWGRSVETLLDEGPFVAGARLNVVDLKLYMIVRWFASGNVDHIPVDVFAKFPRLMGVYEAVKSHPGVVEWSSRG